jgi:hypothetical protein
LKKKYLFILLTLLLPFPAGSQSLSLIDTNYTWSLGEYSFGMPVNTLYYRIIGDTLYSGSLYKKVYSAGDSLFSLVILEGLMRQDSASKVWFKDIHDLCGPQELVYDHNLLTGDSTSGYTCAPEIYAVDSSGSLMIDGQSRKVIWFDPDPNPSFKEAWIEGVGSTFSLIRPHHNFCIMDYELQLLCVKKDTSVIWTNPYFSTCYVGTQSMDEIKEPVLPEVRPNPAGTYAEIIFAPCSSGCISIFNVNGCAVYSGNVSGKTSVRIDTRNFPSGLYFYRIDSREAAPVMGKMIVLH